MSAPISRRLVESSPHRLLRRIGRCLQFGCPPAELVRAVDLVRNVEAVVSREDQRTPDVGTGLFVPALRVDGAGIRRDSGRLGGVGGSLGGDGQEMMVRAARRASDAFVREILGARGEEVEVRVVGTDIRMIFGKLLNSPDTILSTSTLLVPKPHSPTFCIRTLLLSRKHRAPIALVDETFTVSTPDASPDTLFEETVAPTWVGDAIARAARDGVGMFGDVLAGLEEGVRVLERGTWDREDAVEDMGSGSS